MIGHKLSLSLFLILFVTACSSAGPQDIAPSPQANIEATAEEGASVSSLVVVTPLTQTEAGESAPATSTPTGSPTPAATASATPLPSATPAVEATPTTLPTVTPAGQATPTAAATVVQSRGLPVEIQVGQPFVLGLGREGYLAEADLTLLFQEVVEDSRCPTQVDCFWAGQARVAIAVQQGSSAPDELILNTNPAEGEDTATLGAYSLQLVGVEPYPEHPDNPIPPEDYQVTLLISK